MKYLVFLSILAVSLFGFAQDPEAHDEGSEATPAAEASSKCGSFKEMISERKDIKDYAERVRFNEVIRKCGHGDELDAEMKRLKRPMGR